MPVSPNGMPENPPPDWPETMTPFFHGDTASLGWFVSMEKGLLFPSVRVQKISGAEKDYLFCIAPSAACGTLGQPFRLRLENQMIRLVGRLLAHDFNGKIMGIEGIFSEWESAMPSAGTFRDDLALINESFGSFSEGVRLLGLCAAGSGTFSRPCTPREVAAFALLLLSRIMPTSTKIHFTNHPEHAFFDPFHALLCIVSLASAIREAGAQETTSLSIQLLHGEESESLEIRVYSPPFIKLLEYPHLALSHSQRAVSDWLLFFCSEKGRFAVDGDGALVITLPLMHPCHEPPPTCLVLATGASSADAESTSDEKQITLANPDFSSVSEVLTRHASSLQTVVWKLPENYLNAQLFRQAIRAYGIF